MPVAEASTISLRSRELLREDVESILSAQYPSTMAGVDRLLDKWQAAKASLMPFFGEDGRIEFEIEAHSVSPESTDGHRSLVQAVLSSVDRMLHKPGYQASLLCTNWGMISDVVDRSLNRLGELEIVSNSIDRAIEDPLSPGKYLPRGTKVSTYLPRCIAFEIERRGCGKICSHRPEHVISQVSDLVVTSYSNVLSSVKPAPLTGVISINPVDFLLASIHTSGGWSTCHNIYGGAFSTGPLSCMCDSNSVIAYAYSGLKVDKFPVKAQRYSSVQLKEKIAPKVWRQMVYLFPQPGCAMLSVEYPTRKPAIASAVLKHVGSLLYRVRNGSEPPDSEFFSVTDYNGTPKDLRRRVNGTCWMFSDAPTAVLFLKPDGVFPQSWDVGSLSIPCVSCGGDRDYGEYNAFRNTKTLLCDVCRGESVLCSHCGRKFGYHLVRLIEGKYYCGDCMSKVFNLCSVCKRVLTGEYVSAVRGKKFCKECFEQRYLRCDLCGTPVRRAKHDQKRLYVAPDTWYVVCSRCYTYNLTARLDQAAMGQTANQVIGEWVL